MALDKRALLAVIRRLLDRVTETGELSVDERKRIEAILKDV